MPAPLPDGTPILASDLDETVVTVNTFPHFVRFATRWLVQHRDVVGLSRVLAATVRRKVFKGTHLDYKSTISDVANRVDAADVITWAEGIMARYGNPEVAAIVADWDGPKVLCSAAPESYAHVFGPLGGFDAVQGSRWSQGVFVENVQGEKLRRLQSEFPAPIGLALSDEPTLDKPLLDAALSAILVRPEGTSAWASPTPTR